MNGDRITELHILNFRAFDGVKLSLDGLTVLTGKNATGKTSIVEAFELLRKVPHPSFMAEFQNAHGGLRRLIRHASLPMTLTVRIDGPEGPLMYTLSFSDEPFDRVGVIETLTEGTGDDIDDSLLTRYEQTTRIRGKLPTFESMRRGPDVPADRLALHCSDVVASHPAFTRLLNVLESIEVHFPFQTQPRWAAPGRNHPMRASVPVDSAPRLNRFGTNLPNAFHALKNEKSKAHWSETMDYVRLGLGHEVESVNVDALQGDIVLTRDGELQPASLLSEGELAYLAFVALYRLEAPTSLFVFDNPEQQLHPNLLMRVLDFFEDIAKTTPVVLATHSDSLLDGLTDPAAVAVLCERTPSRAVRLGRPDRDTLESWLERYRGLGDVRAAGYWPSVFTRL